MVDYYSMASFAFLCTVEEATILAQAFEIALDLQLERDPGQPDKSFFDIFPPMPDDPFASFRAIFPDPDFPELGADLDVTIPPGDPDMRAVAILGMSHFQHEAVATLIQRACQTSLVRSPVGFEWSLSCSRPRTDGFGGGWCAVFHDRIEFETTGEVLARALEGGCI